MLLLTHEGLPFKDDAGSGDQGRRTTYEVIVSDDGRDSTSEAMVRERFSWARWVAGPRCGPAANRNSGAREARGQWIAFTDDDCVPDPNWLDAYVDAMAHSPSSCIFEGRVYSDPVYSIKLGAPTNEGGNLWTCNLLVRAAFFRALNGFCEEFPFPSMEDVEFRVRVDAAGMVYPFVREAAVYHPPRVVPSYREHYRRSAMSTLKFLELHPEQAERVTLRGVVRGFLFWNAKMVVPSLLRFPIETLIQLPGIAAGQLTFLWLFLRHRGRAGTHL